MSQHSIMVSEGAYRAARRGAAAIDRSERGRLVVSGADRATFLQGLLTNDVAALGSGAGCYAAYLTPQGRMIADVFAYELGDRMLLVVPGAVKDALLTKLDRLIFTEDVQLGDLTDTFDQIALVGPNAAAVAAAVLENVPRTRLDALPEHGNLQARFIGQPVIVTRVADAGEPGFDIFAERSAMVPLRANAAAA